MAGYERTSAGADRESGSSEGSGSDPTLRGPRVTVRPTKEADVDRFHAIIREPSVARWFGDYDRDRVMREYLANSAPGGQVLRSFAIELDGVVIGAVQYWEEPDPDYRHAGLDIFLTTRQQGEGIGPEVLWLMARYLFDDLGHHRITIDPATDNERAIKAYTSIGFKPVGAMRAYERGQDGTWHDNLLMDMLAGDLRAP